MRRAGGAARAAGALFLLASLAMERDAPGAPSLLPQGPRPAPAFRVEDVTGRMLDLDALLRRGPVVLDFWATWCKPCLEEIPMLERWRTAYGPRGLTVIGVSVDGPRNFAKVRPFAARLGVTYPIVLDPDERLRHLYQVAAMPTTFLIDREGDVRIVRVGYRPGEGADMEALIASMLAGENASSDSSAPGDTAADTSRTRRSR